MLQTNKQRVAATQKTNDKVAANAKQTTASTKKQATKLLQNTKTNGDHTKPPTTTTREAVVAEIKADPLTIEETETNRTKMDPQQQNQNENWSSNHRRRTNRRDEQTTVKNGEPTTAVEE
jgi:glucose dehydrogenase